MKFTRIFVKEKSIQVNPTECQVASMLLRHVGSAVIIKMTEMNSLRQR